MPVEFDANADGKIDDQYLPNPINADAAGVFTSPAFDFGITAEGGLAFKLTNKTGVASIKGTAINISPLYDSSFIAATDPYTVIGFVYNSGVADGSDVWIVRDGKTDFLLEDGYAATPNSWIRLSSITAGRCIPQSYPGIDFPAASIAYDTSNGVTISGTILNTRLNDGTRLVIGGTIGAPSIDARITYSGITETPNQFVFNGYFGANRAAGVTVSVWDYVSGGGSWVIMETLPASGTVDVSFTFTAITADMVSGETMLVRLHGADAGVAGDRLYVDQAIFRSSSDTEHFKECGHCLTTAAAGTDVLARMNIHFL